jgi:RNase H-like domain found in reverse transcriptase
VLDEVLNRIKAAGMSIKPKKCTIAAEELHMLGHIIGKDGIKTDPAKIEAVTQYPVPTSKTEVQAFMGLVGYYRHFINNCSAIAQPINATLKKDKRFNWMDEAHQAFNKLKKLLTSAPVLARPDLNKTFRLHTDACKSGLGAVLTQDFEVPGKLNRQGKPLIRERVIAYASRGNHGAESKYGATQLEQLAVVWAVDHFKHYLQPRPFQVVTDHVALKSLMKMKDPKGIYARWIMRLQPYDIDMVYKAGILHGAADAMSRRPHPEEDLPPNTQIERLPKGPPWMETY